MNGIIEPLTNDYEAPAGASSSGGLSRVDEHIQIADNNLRFERTRNSSGLSDPNQSFLSDVSTLPSGIDPPGEENIYEDPETFSRDV